MLDLVVSDISRDETSISLMLSTLEKNRKLIRMSARRLLQNSRNLCDEGRYEASRLTFAQAAAYLVALHFSEKAAGLPALKGRDSDEMAEDLFSRLEASIENAWRVLKG